MVADLTLFSLIVFAMCFLILVAPGAALLLAMVAGGLWLWKAE